MVTKKDKFLAAAQKFLETGQPRQGAGRVPAGRRRRTQGHPDLAAHRRDPRQARREHPGHAGLPEDRRPLRRAGVLPARGRRLQERPQADARATPTPTSSWPTSTSSWACSRTPPSSTTRPPPPCSGPASLKEAMAALAQIVEMNPDQVMSRVQAGRGGRPGRAATRTPCASSAAPPSSWKRRAGPTTTCGWPSGCWSCSPTTSRLAKKVAVRYLERQNPRGRAGQAAGLLQRRRQGRRDPAACWPTPSSSWGRPTRPSRCSRSWPRSTRTSARRSERNADRPAHPGQLDPADPIRAPASAAARGRRTRRWPPARPSPTPAGRRSSGTRPSPSASCDVPPTVPCSSGRAAALAQDGAPRPGRAGRRADARPRCSGSSPRPTSS